MALFAALQATPTETYFFLQDLREECIKLKKRVFDLERQNQALSDLFHQKLTSGSLSQVGPWLCFSSTGGLLLSLALCVFVCVPAPAWCAMEHIYIYGSGCSFAELGRRSLHCIVQTERKGQVPVLPPPLSHCPPLLHMGLQSAFQRRKQPLGLKIHWVLIMVQSGYISFMSSHHFGTSQVHHIPVTLSFPRMKVGG